MLSDGDGGGIGMLSERLTLFGCCAPLVGRYCRYRGSSLECPAFGVLDTFILHCYGMCYRCFAVRSVILFKLYWHKLTTLNYITKLIMFHMIVLLHETMLPRKTTSCSRYLRDLFSCFDKILDYLKLQTSRVVDS